MKRLCALPAAIAATMLLVAPRPATAQAPLTESPITPGFWSFPAHKTTAAKDVAAACADHFQIRFAEGRFMGLKAYRGGKNVLGRGLDEVGRCTFDRDAQTDRCDVKLIHPDGSILGGTLQMRYTFDADKTLKVNVTPKMITDSPVGNVPFDAFPVRCPDDTLWGILNDAGGPAR